MQIQRKYACLAGLIGMACLLPVFAEASSGLAAQNTKPFGSQDKPDYGHDYIFQISGYSGEQIPFLNTIAYFYHARPAKINIANEKTDYTLQINTNWSKKYLDAPCPISASLGCQYREEFVYDTNYHPPGLNKADFNYGKAGIYIRYWMKSASDTFPFRDGACSKEGWTVFAKDKTKTMCFMDSKFKEYHKIPIKQIFGSMGAGPKVIMAESHANADSLVLWNGDKRIVAMDIIPTPTGIPKLASYWQKSEFNIFGADGGTPLQFEPGTSLHAYVFAAPIPSRFSAVGNIVQCNEDTSGEVATKTAANNLHLDSCTGPEGSFTESL